MRGGCDLRLAGRRQHGQLSATHLRRLMFPIGLPGRAARAVRQGAILASDRAIGRTTGEQFLAEHSRRVKPADVRVPA